MAFKQAANGKSPETHNGNMPSCKIIYYQCKSVVKGPENGGITPFSVGSINFTIRRASAFVNGYEKKGENYIRKNYPCLCEQAI